MIVDSGVRLAFVATKASYSWVMVEGLPEEYKGIYTGSNII